MINGDISNRVSPKIYFYLDDLFKYAEEPKTDMWSNIKTKVTCKTYSEKKLRVTDNVLLIHKILNRTDFNVEILYDTIPMDKLSLRYTELKKYGLNCKLVHLNPPTISKLIKYGKIKYFVTDNEIILAQFRRNYPDINDYLISYYDFREVLPL